MYERDGYFMVERLLSEEECDLLKQDARELLAAEKTGVLVGIAARSDRYRRLSEDPRITTRIAPIYPEGITFLSDKFVYKNGCNRYATPWHTDNQYWSGRRPKLSVWIPLDDVSGANGTLKVIPGSHRRQWRGVSSDGADAGGEFSNRIDPAEIDESKALVCEIPRGTCVVFSDALLHASTVNESGRDRYAIISTYHGTRIPEPESVGPATKVLTRA